VVYWLDLVMNGRITLLAFILLLAKVIKLEDVAEKSELLAIILVLGIIGLPTYLIFKILQEFLIVKNKLQSQLKNIEE
tara:strand:- start:151 stop:384 length:234 start_codon:yes stop_codon:yes gene_type:complete